MKSLLSVCFDGTTEVAEVMNIVIRYVSPNGISITQRIIALKLLDHSPNEVELAAF